MFDDVLKMIKGLFRHDGISYEQPLEIENIYCSDQVTCYGGSEHHGDGEQVPVREVGEVVMLERLTRRLVTVGHHIT